MKIRYRCTNKPWHLTHEFDVDEKKEDFTTLIKCLFCGSKMNTEIIHQKDITDMLSALKSGGSKIYSVHVVASLRVSVLLLHTSLSACN